MEQLKIGVVKLKKETPLEVKRQLEAFFIEKGLFLGWTEGEGGIVVSDLDRANLVVITLLVMGLIRRQGGENEG